MKSNNNNGETKIWKTMKKLKKVMTANGNENEKANNSDGG
jgi:hypothetical protein